MNNFYLFLFIAYGLVIGSFLNVVIYRLPLGISVVSGRSFCPTCHHSLGVWDLVPVLSYFFLGRRCRYCCTKISSRYALVELLTAGLFGVSYLLTASLWVAVVNALLMAVLVVLTFIDLDTQLIPDRLHVFIIMLALLKWTLLGWSPFDVLLGAVIVSGPMLLLSYLFDAFGGGDVKLMFAAGLFLGWVSTLVAFLLAVLLGGAVAMWLLWKKRVDGKSMIPFGPYLAIGITVAVWYGIPIAQWYVGLLG